MLNAGKKIAEINLRRFCLLYTSDAADEEDSVDLGGSRVIKKKKEEEQIWRRCSSK